MYKGELREVHPIGGLAGVYKEARERALSSRDLYFMAEEIKERLNTEDIVLFYILYTRRGCVIRACVPGLLGLLFPRV